MLMPMFPLVQVITRAPVGRNDKRWKGGAPTGPGRFGRDAFDQRSAVPGRPGQAWNDGSVPDLDDSLRDLATAYAIATDYWDWRGQHVQVAAETVVAVLAGLGVDASTPEA